MTMLTDFAELAGALVAGRVYPQGAAPPYVGTYINYARINAVEEATLDSNGGLGNLVNTRLQIDVYSLAFADAQAAAVALKAALKNWALQNLTIAEQDMYEPDTKLHRVMIQISIWHY